MFRDAGVIGGGRGGRQARRRDVARRRGGTTTGCRGGIVVKAFIGVVAPGR